MAKRNPHKATLQGTDLEGTDSANITSIGAANSLSITSAMFGGGYIGLVSSIKATVKDENGKRISGGVCKVSALSNNETRVLLEKESRPIGGTIEVSEIMPASRLNEAEDYAYTIECLCGSEGGALECINEDGENVNNSVGKAKSFFTTKQWLSINTVVDDTSYEFKEEIFVCANVTNIDYPERIPLNIYYEIRCNSGTDNNDDTDRTLIAYNKIDDPDSRGISTNTTQMQCKKFQIPEESYLMGRESECYASSEVWILNNNKEEILGYSSTSETFNVSSSELNIEADWAQTSTNKLNSIINLSNYNDISGQGTGNIDIRINLANNGIIDLQTAIDTLNMIKNITIKNSTTTLTQHTNYELETLEDGNLELEIKDVSLSSGWYNITLEF
jgi:hypothetical protein